MKLERTALFCASIGAAGTLHGVVGDYWMWAVPWSVADFCWSMQPEGFVWATGWRMNEVEVWQ